MCSVCATVLRCVRCGGVGWQILLYLVIHQYRIELVGKIGVPMVIILVIIQQLPFRGGRNESRSNRKWDRKSCWYSQLVQVWVAASHNPAKKSLGLLRNNIQHMHLTIVDKYKFTILQWAKLMMSNFLLNCFHCLACKPTIILYGMFLPSTVCLYNCTTITTHSSTETILWWWVGCSVI